MAEEILQKVLNNNADDNFHVWFLELFEVSKQFLILDFVIIVCFWENLLVYTINSL